MSSDPPASPAEEAGADSEPASAFKSEDNAEYTLPPINYFDIHELDEQERNLLVFMSLSSYMDWQERFVENYKEVLVNRATTTGSTEPSMSYGYYNALEELMHRQRALLKSPADDDAGSSDSGADPNEQPWLRSMFRLYRFDVYIKFMLLVFLLKMPYISYLIVTVIYVSVMFLASNTMRRPLQAAARWRLTRYMLSMLRSLYYTVAPVLSTGHSSVSPEQQAERPAGQTVIPDDTSAIANQDGLQLRRKEGADGAANEVATVDTESGSNKPSLAAKAFYQLFVAYILSFIPWWEPNPRYLDESD